MRKTTVTIKSNIKPYQIILIMIASATHAWLIASYLVDYKVMTTYLLTMILGYLIFI